jgi:hypothetical protein
VILKVVDDSVLLIGHQKAVSRHTETGDPALGTHMLFPSSSAFEQKQRLDGSASVASTSAAADAAESATTNVATASTSHEQDLAAAMETLVCIGNS